MNPVGLMGTVNKQPAKLKLG